MARGIVGALGRQMAKKAVSKAASKTRAKPKSSRHAKVEALLRRENKGDARTESKIKSIRAKEEAGLISSRERGDALNKLTKHSKAAANKPKRKVPGVKRVRKKVDPKKPLLGKNAQ